MIRKTIIVVLGSLFFAVAWVWLSSPMGAFDRESTLLATALMVSLGSHYLIRSFVVALTLAGSYSAVILHVNGLVGVANGVGFTLQSLAVEGLAGFGIAFVVGAPFLLVRMTRVPQTPPGFCQQCRYDLTGNESGVCPECGTEIEKPRSARRSL